MSFYRDTFPGLLDLLPSSKKVRINRRVDARVASLAEVVAAPIEEGGLPDITQFPTDLTPGSQSVILTGTNFEQFGAAHATLTTDDGLLNGEILWTAVMPGQDGNDITLAFVAGGALAVAVVADDIVVTVQIGVDTAADVVAAIAAHAVAKYMIAGVASGTGLGFVTAEAEASFTGGGGTGTYGVYPAALVDGVTAWSNTSISVDLDLSAFSDGVCAELMVVADGRERPFSMSILSAASAPSAGRGGIGYLLCSGATLAGQSFLVGTQLWTFQAGAPAALGEVQLAATGALTAVNVAAALNAYSTQVSAHVVAGGAAAATIVAVVPLDASDLAGNYALDAALTPNMTDQDMQSGAADAFEGGYPLTYVISAGDLVEWAAGRYVPVACYPFTDEPNLISMLFVRPLGGGVDEIGSTFTSRVRFAASGNGYWVMELLDPAPADFQALDELRIVVGQ